ncbi:MAG: hypothetical protein LCH58_10990 [Bacteroidetes bacterium]|jgi:hypothetical protein|uniref:hypothetical protein n=1 Tax=Phnomibacter sp. TaxID=2836217 RepID=UPI002FDE9847|nr:hypothetical protein [Bacteroidota bacterium]
MNKEIILKSIGTWLRSLLTYALITLPSLFFPLMYIMSLGLAIIWSLPALLLFVLMLWLLSMLHVTTELKFYLLLLSTAGIVFLCTWGAAWQVSGGRDVWNNYLEFVLFPIAGILAAVLVVLVRRQTLMEVLATPPFSHHSSLSL